MKLNHAPCECLDCRLERTRLKKLGDALSRIECHFPNGSQLVAQALSGDLESVPQARRRTTDTSAGEPVGTLGLLAMLGVTGEGPIFTDPLPPWDEDKRDEWSEAIDAAFPTRSGKHDLYATAMKMVSHRHTKAALVSLVNWLLSEQADLRHKLAADAENQRMALRDERDAWKKRAQTAEDENAMLLDDYPENHRLWDQRDKARAERDAALAEVGSLRDEIQRTVAAMSTEISILRGDVGRLCGSASDAEKAATERDKARADVDELATALGWALAGFHKQVCADVQPDFARCMNARCANARALLARVRGT
jgi:hypothetical protein